MKSADEWINQAKLANPNGINIEGVKQFIGLIQKDAQNSFEKGELTVDIENWDHTCTDGCCYTYGTEVFINGEKASQGDFRDIESIIVEVLEHLGYKVNI